MSRTVASNTVTEIDPRTYRVIRTFPTGRQPQHVVPSWDLRALWVNNDLGNSLTPIDPVTALPGRPVAVHDPYNLYFTPDGKHAVVMASNDHRLVFLDPHTMAVQKSVPVPCAGVNHADFAADGRYLRGVVRVLRTAPARSTPRPRRSCRCSGCRDDAGWRLRCRRT